MTLIELRNRRPALVRLLYVLSFLALGVLVLEQIDALAATYWAFDYRDAVTLSAMDWTYLRWAPALSVLASLLCAWVFMAGILSETKGAVPGWVAVVSALTLGVWPLFFWLLSLLP